MFEDYYGMSPEEAGLLQALLSGEQGFPTAQPIVAMPVSNEQSAPTPQPVQSEPYTNAASSGWVQGMDPSMRPGWQPDEAGMAELGAWLQSSPNSILNSPLYSTTVPQAAQDYIKEQAAQGKTLIYDPATQAALGSAISPFISTGVSYKPFDPNNPMANMGQVFKFTTYGDEPNAPVVFQPGQTYSLYDYKGENLLGQAKTPEELQALINLSNQRQAQGWTLKGDNVPDYAGGGFGTGSAGGIYGRAPQDNTLKTAMLAALVAMGAGALTGGIGTAGAATGGAGAGTAAGTTAATAAGTGAATGGLGALVPTLGEIVVTGAPAAGISAGTAAALTGATVGGLAASGLLSPPTTPAPAPAPAPAPQDIVVTAPTAPTPVIPPVVPPLLPPTPPIAPVEPTPAPTESTPAPEESVPAPEDIVVTAPPTPAPVLPPVVPPLLPPTPPVAPVEPTPSDIVVEAPKPKTYDEMISSIVGGVAPTLVSTLPAAPSTTPTDTEKSSLLNDIMKYYALGSGLLDMLGVGQGGGTTTPYTSTLGVLPTFGRGQFTPFQGDYETYGQGPEWNFFGGQ